MAKQRYDYTNHGRGFHNNATSQAARRRKKLNRILQIVGSIVAIGVLFLVYWVYSHWLTLSSLIILCTIFICELIAVSYAIPG